MAGDEIPTKMDKNEAIITKVEDCTIKVQERSLEFECFDIEKHKIQKQKEQGYDISYFRVNDLLSEKHKEQGYDISDIHFTVSPFIKGKITNEEIQELSDNLKKGIYDCIENPEKFKYFDWGGL